MQRRLMLIALIVTGILASFFSTPPVSAQTTTGISIAPLRQETEINAGFVFEGFFEIKNSGIQTQQMDLNAEAFKVSNQAYDYLFDAEAPETDWVTFDQDTVILDSRKSTVVNYKISVPLGTEPGGYYIALFATNRTQAANGISPTERIASLTYLTVTGEASRNGQLLQINSPLVVLGDSIWSASLQNSGTLHFRSTYSAKVYSVFGQEISGNEDSRLILPSSVRLIEKELPKPELLGMYKIVYTVSLGDAPSQQETRWFLYLPPIQTIAIIGIIIGAITLFKSRRH